MKSEFRFGKRIPLPSTRQIIHELRMMMAAESIANLQRELKALSNDGPVVTAPASKLERK
ncbi:MULTISPECIES: hypothetical protein [unclassified Beijerinckia]|uniref:hypothetical protein n=1 Tax=unclassified Beijerinckia TaxID=2638183 RepID=UPI000899049F|nr:MULTISPECIES: hypothetical protein [unclassified Beijerinckia]MDH7797249.1 hypothetical protein [Beijerinckia sp. GAS462]SEC77999.1 hypothetical protein SAMN05443249_3541 [Beijerinckia sp. 28-YEA-48]